MKTLVKSKFNHNASSLHEAMNLKKEDVKRYAEISESAYLNSSGCQSRMLENILNEGLSVEEIAYVCYLTGKTIESMKYEYMNNCFEKRKLESSDKAKSAEEKALISVFKKTKQPFKNLKFKSFKELKKLIS